MRFKNPSRSSATSTAAQWFLRGCMLLVGVIIVPQAYAATFTDTFDNNTGVSTSITRTLGGASFTYTFTAAGDAGDMAWENEYGEINSPSLNLRSGTYDTGTTEVFTIARTDGENFAFSSLYINNTAGDTVTVGGYLDGALVSSSQTVANGSSASVNFGQILVDEVRVSSTDFLNVNLDSFSGDTSVMDVDGSLVESLALVEPVAMPTTINSAAAAIGVLDFTLSDGGGSDGLPMTVSQVVVNVMGTSTDLERGKVTWRLSGPDVSNATGTYNAGSDTITFSSLPISVVDGGSETYTINAYYNDNTNLVEGHTFILSVDGDTDVTVGGSGTQMGATSAVSNGKGLAIEVTATELAFSTQPAGSVSGLALSVQPVVSAQDAFGNTDKDFTETITLTEASAGMLNNASAVASSGVAAFTNLTYNATADQQSFTLTANDEDGEGSDLPSVNASSVTSDVVATALTFFTQPAPLNLSPGSATSLTTVPVVQAVDSLGIVDTGYSSDITLYEVNGPGSVYMSGTGDTDGSGTTVSITPSSGVSTFNNMQITYTPNGSGPETFNLRAQSGGLSTADSAQFTSVDNTPPSVSSVSLTGSPAANASTVSYVVSFDKTASNVSVDDFSLTTTGTTAADIANVSATSGSAITVTVNNIAGEGTLRLDLKSNTNIIDGNGNGNGTNGFVMAFTNGDIHTLDAVAPTVTGVTATSADGIYGVGDVISLAVNFSEIVSVTGAPTLTLETGTTDRSVSYSSGSGSNTLTFNYTVQAGDTTTDLDYASTTAFALNGGTVTDAAGNAATLTLASPGAAGSLAANKNIVIDSAAPTLTASQPADNSTNFGHDDDLVFTFSEAVVAGTSGANTITVRQVSDDLTVANIAADNAAVSVAGSIVTVDLPVNLNPLTEYYLQIGSDAFTDVGGNSYAGISDTTALNFTVANSAPVAGNDTSSTNEDTAVDIAVLGNDTDSDSSLNAASVMIGGAPSNGSTSINTGTGVITYTPNANFEGIDSFTYTVEDVWGQPSNSATVTITVNPVNDAPVANNDAVATNEDTLVSIDVMSNDIEVDASDTPGTLTLAIGTEPTHGVAVINNGLIDYTPAPEYEGTDTFTYTIEDSGGLISNVATVTVSVIGVNDVPVAMADSANVDEDDSVVIDVLINDSDIDGTIDAMSVAVVTDGAHGTAVVNAATGAITYTPDADYNGTDTFTYQVDDDLGGTSNEATVTVTVSSINDAPVAADDTVTALQEDTPHNINVLGNDSDVDGTLNVASVEIVSVPSNGAVSVSTSTGMVTYTPSENYFGSDSFSYRVMDELGEWSNEATVTLTVDSVNDMPTATDDTVVTDEDTAVLISLLDNDSDIDGALDITSVTMVSPASNGSVDNHGDGTVTYTPNSNFNGSDSFSYTVRDDEGGESAMASVTITVNPVNDAPKISGTASTTAEALRLYSFSPTASDPDSGDTLSFSLANAPEWLSINVTTGRVSGTPDESDVGLVQGIVVSVSDGAEAATLPGFDINVTPSQSNTAPTISGTPTATVQVGNLYRFAPQASDAENDPLQFTLQGAPNWLSIDPATGVINGIAADADEGTYRDIILRVSDGEHSVELPAFSINVVAGVDTDGDNVSDYQEGIDGTDQNDPSDFVDVTPPVLSVPPAPILHASGLYTEVNQALLLGLAFDADDATVQQALRERVSDAIDAQCCEVNVAGFNAGPKWLRSGRHEIVWIAEDASGNQVQMTQVLDIWPQVSLGMDQREAEGRIAEVGVYLNGDAPEYPVSIAYQVSAESTATASDYQLSETREVTFTEALDGRYSQTIAVSLLQDTETEADETVIFELAPEANAEPGSVHGFAVGARAQHELIITEANLPPEVSIELYQDGRKRSLVAANGAQVDLLLDIEDANSDDYTLSWSGDQTLMDLLQGEAPVLSFNPESLTAGIYQLMAQVTDAQGVAGETTLTFAVVNSLKVLGAEDADGDGMSDREEGYDDPDGNGIPAYQDRHNPQHLIAQRQGAGDDYLMQCETGLRCALGASVAHASAYGVELAADDLPADEGFETVGGIFDFRVQSLPEAGASVRVAIALNEAIPAEATYRKLVDSQWIAFTEDANNALHSAAGSPGYCPSPGSDEWQAGLIEGHWCVQLTIEDGGANDADGRANRTVVDPGAVVKPQGAGGGDGELPSPPGEPVDPGASGGNGGGGSIGAWGLLFLLWCAVWHRRRLFTR
ncbi:beta strand repeat-containing protein [Gilvimarinus chinensis]|uniref:beta strand repeat-containing protein n=1 Tax=Gilvimarinus chinensis TaxID=396005 RepID=UPI0004755C44|nr:Ig-like domain-containing protein [Gilvimarinus chinensis]